MMLWKCSVTFALICCLAVVLHTHTSYAQDKPLVLIVHSYEQGNVCAQPQADGVIDALRETGLFPESVDVKEFFMDTKKTYTSKEAIEKRGTLALEVIEKFKPEIVVILDDNAFNTVGLALVDMPGVSVVFSGMNSQPEVYNAKKKFMESRKRPGHNITGVYEKLHLKRALSVLAGAVPGIKKVVGITDVSPTGGAIIKQFELEAKEELPVEWETRTVQTFKEYKELVLALNKDDSVSGIYPVTLTLATEDGGRVTAPEILRWTVLHSTKPEIPLNYSFSRLGLFGGASVDFRSMGKHAGMLVAAILHGKNAGDLSIVEAPDYAIVFNLGRAKMLGLTVPEDILLAADRAYKEVEILSEQ